MSSAARLLALAATGAVALVVPAAASAAPPNDHFADAQPLAAGTTVVGTNVDATVEPGERLWGWNLHSSVWFSYVPPKDGQVRWNACEKDFSLNLDLWTGTDPARTSYLSTGSGACGGSRALTQWVNVEGGRRYLLQATSVGGGLRPTGTFRLRTEFDGSVDVHPPAVQVIWGPGPGDVIAQARPRWQFASSESDTTFACAVDENPLEPCDLSWTVDRDLVSGSHELRVQGTDAAGNVSEVVRRAFSVDRTPPRTVFRSGPVGETEDTAPTFAFGPATPETATFTCSLDGAPPVACASPWTTPALAPGGHRLTVRATDALGNAEVDGATRAFVVRAPDVPQPGTGAAPGSGAGAGSTAGGGLVPGPAPSPSGRPGASATATPAVQRPRPLGAPRPTIVRSRRGARGRTHVVRVRCAPTGATCRARLRVTARVRRGGRTRTVVVRTVPVVVAAGRTRTVTVRLPRGARGASAVLRPA